MLSACTQYQNRYLEREDAVTFSAGDAVASNSAVQIPILGRAIRTIRRSRWMAKESPARLPATEKANTNRWRLTRDSVIRIYVWFRQCVLARARRAFSPSPAQGAAPAPGPQGY
jgi:hypothetical protein